MLMADKQKCVIFGAGDWGKSAFSKINSVFEVVAYSDNNNTLWDAVINGVQVVPPTDLPNLCLSDIKVIILSEAHYFDIFKQLKNMGINALRYNNLLGAMYEYRDPLWHMIRTTFTCPYKKEEKGDFSVLFVQGPSGTRTSKIAKVLKDIGVKTYSAYTQFQSPIGKEAYLMEYCFLEYSDLLDFVNNSEFDIIHCSNTPDTFVNMLSYSNNPIIHDSHDISSMFTPKFSSSDYLLEMCANTFAGGFMYTCEGMLEAASALYGTDTEKSIVVENYPDESMVVDTPLPKLSDSDGQIHCVYEGIVVPEKERSVKSFETVFLKITETDNVHIHIYSPCNYDYCKYLKTINPRIHFEGDLISQKLTNQLSQYDIGLAVYNLEYDPSDYLSCASHNKVYEYLAAGVPVATNIKKYVTVLEKTNAGGCLDVGQDIYGQLKTIKDKKISRTFLKEQGMTMEASAERILAFYKRILALER
jgi:hypothetical protein